MKIAYSEAHRLHDPQFFLVRGWPERNAEQPARADMLLSAVQRLGADISAPEEFGLGPCAAIHTPAYLEFLSNAYDRWQAVEHPSMEVVPNMHPINGQPTTYCESLVGRAGYHLADMACPVGPGTWQAALKATHSACQAAQWLIEGERGTYALCRPPGHHADAERAGGFCYLNNAAVAAQYLLSRFGRVAVLDVDVHHGNGTQSIFYCRRDVFTVSLHADPSGFYPFYSGYAHERGVGVGLGYNLNIPLARGTGDAAYLAVLKTATAQIRAFAPGAVVVALGLDASVGDPFNGLAITTTGFTAIGHEISRLDVPTVLVQEGGYLAPALADNLEAVLTGFNRGA
jgi:acetoin utilization deacetylase AcuC-like enzyme